MGLMLSNLTNCQEYSVVSDSQAAVWPTKDQSSDDATHIFHGPPVAHAWPKSGPSLARGNFLDGDFDYWSLARLLVPVMHIQGGKKNMDDLLI